MVGLERRPSQPVGGREKQGVGAGRRRGAAAGAGGGDPGAAAARGARRPPRGCALHPPLAHLAAPASCAGVWPPARPPPRSLPLAATLPSRPPPWCACGGAGDRAIAAPPRAGRRKCRAAGLGAAAPRGGRDRGDRGPHRRLPFLPPPPTGAQGAAVERGQSAGRFQLVQGQEEGGETGMGADGGRAGGRGRGARRAPSGGRVGLAAVPRRARAPDRGASAAARAPPPRAAAPRPGIRNAAARARPPETAGTHQAPPLHPHPPARNGPRAR